MAQGDIYLPPDPKNKGKKTSQPNDWVTVSSDPSVDDWETVDRDVRYTGNPVQGFWDPIGGTLHDMYGGVLKSSKTAQEHIKAGKYPEAFREIFHPILDPIEEFTKMHVNYMQGKPPIETSPDINEARRIAGTQLIGAAGIPTERFKEAWESKDYPRLAGQALGAATAFYVGHKIGKLSDRYKVSLEEKKPPPPPPSVPPMKQGVFDFGEGQPNLPFHGEPSMEVRTPFDERFQRGPLGITGTGAPETRMETPQAIEGPEVGPYGITKNHPLLPLDEFAQQVLPMDMPPSPDLSTGQGLLAQMRPPTLPPTAPTGEIPPTTTGEVLPDKVYRKNWDQETIRYYKDRGYVPGGVDPATNQAYMVRKDTTTEPVSPPETIETTTPVGEGDILTFDENGQVIIPKSTLTKTVIDNMQEQGIRFLGKDKNGNGIFKRFLSETKAEVDFQELWENLKRLLGRDPTELEMAEARNREIQSDKVTGRVVQFTPKFAPEKIILPVNQPESVTNEPRLPGLGPMGEAEPRIVPDISKGGLDVAPLRQREMFPPEVPTKPINTTSDIMERMMNEIDAETDYETIRQIREYWEKRAQEPNDVVERFINNMFFDAARDKSDQLYARQESYYDPTLPRTPQIHFNEPTNQYLVTDQTGAVIYEADSRAEAQEFINMREFGGPRPVAEGVDQPVLPTRGQQNLPILNQPGPPLQPEPIRPRSEDYRYQPPEPKQQSMIHDMIDAEIKKFLDGEDATPPEMRDLPKKLGPTIIDEIKKESKRFLEDESGEVDPVELRRRMRELLIRNENIARRHAGEEPLDEWEVRQRQERADADEITSANNLESAVQNRTYWRDELARLNEIDDDRPAQEHAANMYQAARQRIRVLEEEAATSPVDRDEQEIYQSSTIEEAQALHDMWDRRYWEAAPGSSERQHAFRIANIAGSRVNDLVENPFIASQESAPEASSTLSNRLNARTQLQDLRARHPTDPTLNYYNNVLNRLDAQIARATQNNEMGDLVRDSEQRRQVEDRLVEYFNENGYALDIEARLDSTDDISTESARLDTTSELPSESSATNPDVMEIEAAQTMDELRRLNDRWDSAFYDLHGRGEYGHSAHASQMASLASRRMNELANRNTREQTRLSNRDNYDRLDQARQESGPLNPPITFGLQPSKARRMRSIPKAKYQRLKYSASIHGTGNISENRVPSEHEARIWDNFAQTQLEHLSDGPPGLSITDESYTYGKQYRIIYRGEDGKPVAMAKVEENPQGVRSVPTLASYRQHPDQIIAVHRVGEAIFDMNAGEINGPISVFTELAIAKLLRAISSETGSVELDSIIRSIIALKKYLLGGKSPKIKTPEDLVGQTKKTNEFFEDEGGWIDPNKIKEKIGGFFKPGEKGEPSAFEETIGLPTALTTLGDLSPGFRQAFTQVFTPEWRKAWGPALKAGWDVKKAKEIDRAIRQKELFRPRVNTKTGKMMPSVAEAEAGVKLIEGSHVSKSENDVASTWVETGGSIPYLSKAYRVTYGRYARASNRFYATFLNHLRANTTERMYAGAEAMSEAALATGEARPGILKQKFTPDEAIELNPRKNMKLAREIGDYINTATGRGPLKGYILPYTPEINIEKAAGILRYGLFSPRNLAAKMRMLNPSTYIMAHPYVRKQYLKSALGAGVAWYTMTQLAKGAAAAGLVDATVSDDLDSADYGKIRFGNTRLDPGGSFQQFIVAAHRFWDGGWTSSATGQWHRFGSGYQAQTQEQNMQRFFVNKLNPVMKFAYDLGNATEYNPFHVYDRSLQMFAALVHQDFIEIVTENPNLLPLMVPIVAGMGTQTYEKGESVGKLVDPENDWLVTGGGPADLMPWDNPRQDSGQGSGGIFGGGSGGPFGGTKQGPF